jgi:hypothetical protein
MILRSQVLGGASDSAASSPYLQLSAGGARSVMHEGKYGTLGTEWVSALVPRHVQRLKEKSMPVEVFDGRDEGHRDPAYLEWLEVHPRGYVLNALKNPGAGYLQLHRTRCFHISQYKMARSRGPSRNTHTSRSAPTRSTSFAIGSICVWVQTRHLRAWGVTALKGFDRPFVTMRCDGFVVADPPPLPRARTVMRLFHRPLRAAWLRGGFACGL